jgi:hypothetical protein
MTILFYFHWEAFYKHSLHFGDYLSTLASLTPIILFSEMLKFSEIISSKSK